MYDSKLRALLLGTALLCAACSRPAQIEPDVLNVYNWAEFIDPAVVDDFEKESGIKVHYDVYDTSEMMEVKLLSGHSHYDVVVPNGAFFEREVKAGLYRKLDPALLPNLHNLDPAAVTLTESFDPSGEHGVDYAWLASVGFGYDAGKLEARLAGAPFDSWRMLFDPAVLVHFQDCGVTLLDAPVDVVGAVLAYLGRDPNGESAADLAAAMQVLKSIRRYIRYFDSSRYVSDLANGDVCLALGWSGDFVQARRRAREANAPSVIRYVIPREGSLSIVDMLAIPADAPHPAAAHRFIDYLLRPEVAAKNVMVMNYASGVAGSASLLSDAVRTDEAIYPSPQQQARLMPVHAHSQEFTRELMRAWTRFKTGQ